MQFVKKFAHEDLKFEYGLDGIRSFPWAGITPPFEGGYCIVRPHRSILDHVNSPTDEDEMFIAVAGEAVVVMDGNDHPVGQGDLIMVPRGVGHYIRNDSDQPFHFYTLWWNSRTCQAYVAAHDVPLAVPAAE
jgi:oxalate decarboxylase/phosphoglucose isomerase-like protein (cupin superfamily)